MYNQYATITMFRKVSFKSPETHKLEALWRTLSLKSRNYLQAATIKITFFIQILTTSIST